MLRVGVLYRIGHALDFLAAHPLSEQQFLTSFGNWEGISGTTIIETCKRLGWITSRPSDELLITSVGQAVCEVKRAPARLRLQLEHIISITRPAWAALAVRGRNAVVSYAPAEAVQCLNDAALVDGTDDEVVAWWDRLAAHYRNIRDEEHMATGRLGEKSTFLYERQRTKVDPNWVALDNNYTGYDLISRVDANDPRKLMIEVKASTLPWEDAEAILTRHEWDVLRLSKHACLDLWCVATAPYAFCRIATDQLAAFVPADVGDARWLTLSLPFALFRPIAAVENP